MAHSFKVGDRVRVVAGPRAGAVTEIAHGPVLASDGSNPLIRGKTVYGLSISRADSRGFIAWAPPEWLRHYYDGNEKGEWTDELRSLCKPKEHV